LSKKLNILTILHFRYARYNAQATRAMSVTGRAGKT